MLLILLLFTYLGEGLCLWSKGIVHYAISTKDYDVNSQEIITSTLIGIEKEICVKFFSTPPNYSATPENKILYINNPNKRKTCQPDFYNYTGSVVDMIIGYKCMNGKEITRIVVNMLKASIEQSPVSTVNSYDLLKKFQAMDERPISTYLTPEDRNFINSRYHRECVARGTRGEARRAGEEGVSMSADNYGFYKDKLWPLGVVIYGVDKNLLKSEEQHYQLKHLKQAMTSLELASCVVFQELAEDGVLRPKSLLWFTEQGDDSPQLGFKEGNQTISLSGMTEGAPGHYAHTLNQLMRALGLPMVSNRHDRDYYVNVNWNNVIKGKEHYVEKTPREAWLLNSDYGYDFDSVTHAPANYMCRDCRQGQTTIEPTQDHLWQRTLSMGKATSLSSSDRERLRVLYQHPCQDRYRAHA